MYRNLNLNIMTILELINQPFVRMVFKSIDDTDPALVPASYGLSAIPWVTSMPYPGLHTTGESFQVCSVVTDIPQSVRDAIPQGNITDGALVDTLYFQKSTSAAMRFSSAVIICPQTDESYSSAIYVCAFETVLVPAHAMILILSADTLSGFNLKYNNTPPTAVEILSDVLTIVVPVDVVEADFNYVSGIDFVPVSLNVSRPQAPYGNGVFIPQNHTSSSIATVDDASLPFILPALTSSVVTQMAEALPLGVCRWTGSSYINYPMLLDKTAARFRYVTSLGFAGARYPIMDPSFTSFRISDSEIMSAAGSLYQLVPAPLQASGRMITKQSQVVRSEETSAHYISGGFIWAIGNIVTQQPDSSLQFNQRVHNDAGLTETSALFYSPKQI